MGMLLVKNGDVYAPRRLGNMDILIGGGKILAVGRGLDVAGSMSYVETIDASGCIVVPGFIDGHQHFIGGGGEGGFHTRTPELQLSMNLKNGVTTAIGLLGTDSLTRSLEDLYAKTYAFNAEGMTAFMLTGAYWYPSPTLTGSVAKDLVFCDPVIGVKLALSDTRGPHLEAGDLARLASDVFVAALIANKPGTITVHTGVRPQALDLILEVVRQYGILPAMFVPTHINRNNPKLLDQVFELARGGATVDATCLKDVATNSEKMSAADFAVLARDNGLLDHVSFSSDAGGSLPKWNEDHSRITGMGIGTPDTLLLELRTLVQEKCVPLEEALLPLTSTPARTYGLEGRKGTIAEDADADVLVLRSEDLQLRDVIAKGQVAVRDGQVVKKGYFE
ncbi:MAG: beta-aspartyl-peptidase [Rectinema sp.]